MSNRDPAESCKLDLILIYSYDANLNLLRTSFFSTLLFYGFRVPKTKPNNFGHPKLEEIIL